MHGSMQRYFKSKVHMRSIPHHSERSLAAGWAILFSKHMQMRCMTVHVSSQQACSSDCTE